MKNRLEAVDSEGDGASGIFLRASGIFFAQGGRKGVLGGISGWDASGSG